MSFESIDFWIFLSGVLLIYWQLSEKRKNLFLLISSMLFYGMWDVRFVLVLAISIGFSFFMALKMQKTDLESDRRRLLFTTIMIQLGLLVVFKLPINSIFFPIGVSFFTFQSISYNIDVYLRRIPPCQRLAEYALFRSFFPTLLSGPIERAGNMLSQIRKVKRISKAELHYAVYLVVWGIFKKLFVADQLLSIVSNLVPKSSLPQAPNILLYCIGVSFYVYANFSAYSDIVRGIAKLFGYQISMNFITPFFSSNITEFWRNWHITLSQFFRDYVFNPILFFTRHLYFSIFVTFVLIGVWHSFSWNYFLYGIYNAILVIGYIILKNYGLNLHLPKSIRILITFAFCSFGFLIFFSDSPEQIHLLSASLFQKWLVADLTEYLKLTLQVIFFILPVLIHDWMQFRYNQIEIFLRFSPKAQYSIALTLFYLTILTKLWWSEPTAVESHYVYFDF